MGLLGVCVCSVLNAVVILDKDSCLHLCIRQLLCLCPCRLWRWERDKASEGAILVVNLHSVEFFAVHDGSGDGLHSLLCPCREVGDSCVEAHVSVCF